MFNKTADYLYGELTATVEDYKLLENINRATITKYTDMKHIAANVSKSMNELNEKCMLFFMINLSTRVILYKSGWLCKLL